MTRKKKPLAATTKKSNTPAIEDELDFITSAKSDVLQPQTTRQVGRPKLEEDLTKKSIALRTEDVRYLELLSAQWALESDTRLGLTSVVRSIVASIRPALEQMEAAPSSEEELRALIDKKILK